MIKFRRIAIFVVLLIAVSSIGARTFIRATRISLDTTNFTNNLSGSDTDVQLAMDTLDDIAISGADEKVKVSADDTTANFLLLKLAEGTGIDLTETNPGGDEDVTIAFDSTEIGTTTWGSGSAITWTFDASGATDTTIAWGDDVVTTTAVDAKVTGNFWLSGSNQELRFYEGANFVGFEAPALAGDQIWVLPAADGNADEVLKTDGAGNLDFSTVPYNIAIRTDCYTYHELLAADTDFIKALRTWQNETVATVDGNPDVPRSISGQVVPDLGETLTGTITINGISCDGAVIAEAETINTTFPTIQNVETDKAFGIVTSVVITSATGLGNYSIGIEDRIGFCNIPWNASTDLYKINLNGSNVSTGGYTISATEGTIDFDDVTDIVAGDDVVIWVRPFK